MDFCCCCFQSSPERSRTIDEHVPLSSSRMSSADNRNSVSTIYTAPPIPRPFSSRSLHTPPKHELGSPITQAAVPEKELTLLVSDLTDLDLKKKDRETIDECPICLEEYEIENPKLLTKCGHDFHLACILEWMERSDACPVCDKELEITES